MNTREKDVRTWSMLCHLAALAGMFFTFGNVIGPLLVWQIKKNELPEIEPYGKESVNFQITIAIIQLIATVILIGSVGTAVLWRGPFFTLGTGFGLASIIGVVHLIALILVIIASVRANRGEFYKYPFAIRFVK
jgi:uncharacterized protein